MTTYKITCTFTEPMLGTAPTDEDIYKNFIVAKRLREAKKIKSEDAPALEATIAAKQEEEVSLLPKPQDDEDHGITVFRHDGTGLILMDYMVRGFLKEAARSVSGIWGVESKIDRFVFVGRFVDGEFRADRRIPITRDGKQLTQAEDKLERPLRAQTMRGPRVTLACSEVVNPGAQISFHLIVLPLGETKEKLTEEEISSWITMFGQLNGFGQWRSGSYGRFRATMTKIK